MQQNIGESATEDGRRKFSKHVTIAPNGQNRKVTKESMFAARQVRRDTCLKNLREAAFRVSNGDKFSNMDTLLRDQVNILHL